MNITKPGVLISDRIYTSKCFLCGCEFEFSGKEAYIVMSDLESRLDLPCPQVGCDAMISIFIAEQKGRIP